ncbi:MAG: ATP-binding protein, partial [Alphaproteobacteria bacterium]
MTTSGGPGRQRTPVEITEAIKGELRDAFANLFEITQDFSVTKEKGLYGVFYVKPSKNVRNMLSVDRELLVLISTFQDQQTRTITAARELIEEAAGRLDATTFIVVHSDFRGDSKLKNWGREQSLTVLPIFTTHPLPAGNELLRTLANELFSHDPFDVTGPVADDSQFYGRREEAIQLARRLQQGQIRSVFGIRKIGKTSILHRIIKETTKTYDCTAVLIDGQSDAIFSLSSAQLLNSIAHTISKSESGGEVSLDILTVRLSLADAAQALLEAVKSSPKVVVLFFDEIDYLTPTSPTADHWKEDFNGFWRNLRATYQATSVGSSKLSILVSGVSSKWFMEESIGGVENAALMFVPEEYLSPLPRGAGAAMIRRLGKLAGLVFNDTTAELIAAQSADMPFWIRKACSHIHNKIEVGLRPFEPQAEAVADFMAEFISTDGVAMSEVALSHLFRVYPELQQPALQCAAGKGSDVPGKYLRTLEKYGVIESAKTPSVNGQMMASGLENFVESNKTPSTKSAASEFGDWADELAIISRRRNVMERSLRSIVSNFLRFDSMNNSGATSAKERVLIQDAVDVYVLHRCPELKTGEATIKELALLFGFYDGRYLDELTEVAQEYTAAARAGDPANDIAPHKPGTIRNRLAYLRAACRYAQKHHGVGDRDVRHEVPVPAVRNSRQVYASRAEMLVIARKCGASPAEREARALIRLAFYSGMR